MEELSKLGIKPTSMIDISDGLSSDLLHICSQSNVGCRVFEERLPIDYQTAMMAESFNLNVATVALNGGEDYEMLFTVPLSVYEQVKTVPGIHLIGHITDASLESKFVTRDGHEMMLEAQGWSTKETNY